MKFIVWCILLVAVTLTMADYRAHKGPGHSFRRRNCRPVSQLLNCVGRRVIYGSRNCRLTLNISTRCLECSCKRNKKCPTLDCVPGRTKTDTAIIDCTIVTEESTGCPSCSCSAVSRCPPQVCQSISPDEVCSLVPGPDVCEICECKTKCEPLDCVEGRTTTDDAIIDCEIVNDDSTGCSSCSCGAVSRCPPQVCGNSSTEVCTLVTKKKNDCPSCECEPRKIKCNFTGICPSDCFSSTDERGCEQCACP